MENFENKDAYNEEVAAVGRLVEEREVDTEDVEKVLALTHELYGERYPDAEIEAIVNAFYAKEHAAAAEADRLERDSE